MTYCCGVLVRDGLVLIADTRTNAGLDNISTFRKLHVFEEPGRHVLGLAAAGNLSVTQSVISLLKEGVEDTETGEPHQLRETRTMFQAAQLVGLAIRQVHRMNGVVMEQATSVNFDVSFLLGGQIAGGPMALYMVYSAGNFIECTPDTPFLQIGEHKYGKPVLDRSVVYEMGVADALKSSLISMDSTMRSNLGVGLPIDVLVVCPDKLQAELKYRIEPSEPYFHDLRERWSAALRAAHSAIPRPPFLKDVQCSIPPKPMPQDEGSAKKR